VSLREKYEKLERKNGDIIFLQVKYFQKTVQPIAKKLTFETNGKTLAPPLFRSVANFIYIISPKFVHNFGRLRIKVLKWSKFLKLSNITK